MNGTSQTVRSSRGRFPGQSPPRPYGSTVESPWPRQPSARTEAVYIHRIGRVGRHALRDQRHGCASAQLARPGPELRTYRWMRHSFPTRSLASAYDTGTLLDPRGHDDPPGLTYTRILDRGGRAVRSPPVLACGPDDC